MVVVFRTSLAAFSCAGSPDEVRRVNKGQKLGYGEFRPRLVSWPSLLVVDVVTFTLRVSMVVYSLHAIGIFLGLFEL